jgi:lipopolysaccharide/colanic/teichoic acid biosynthesis glycosyltransferase
MKRAFDFSLSLLLLILLSPIILFVGVLVFRGLGRSILFKQQRPGLHMKPFHIYKFRTMTDERDADGELLPDETRLNQLGYSLRKLSLDELPQLINVLKGEMSLVGPRPLLMKYLPYFSEREKSRFLIRPGITGLAQVSGRNDLPWDLRLELDVIYVENRSFLFDLKILGMTLIKVFQRESVAKVPSLALRDLDLERRG